jgi:hypothetical protein
VQAGGVLLRQRQHRCATPRKANVMKPPNAIKLTIVPIELKEANEFVAAFHRHHKPVLNHRFSIGVIDQQNNLRGVAVIGRPVARLAGHPRQVLEVTRLATDETPNACSMLYGAAARIGKQLGYGKIQTYILVEEPGTSLKAAGWSMEATSRGRQWKHTDGRPRRTDQPMGDKTRWAMLLNPMPPNEVNSPASRRELFPLFEQE